MKAVAYIRVSTDDQAERGMSLAEQRRQITDAIAAEGWDLHAVYEDAGFSGARADRPALLEMLSARDELDVLVLWSLDRLGRDVALLATVVGKLRESNVRIEVLNGGLELETAEGQLHFHVRAAVTQYERQMIARRCRMAADGMASQGRYNGPPVFGYRFEAGLLVPERAEVPIVERMCREFLAGSSYSAIARGLNADGIRTRRGNVWRTNVVRELLANPVYTGRIRSGDSVVDGVHEAIIDRDIFDQVRDQAGRIRALPGKGRGRPVAGRHLFTRGLLKCGVCGESMLPTRGRRPGHSDHYICAGRQQLGCTMPAIQRLDVDQAAYAYFEQVGLDVDATREALAGARDQKLLEVREIRAAAEQEERRADERLSRVRRDYQDGRLAAEDWAEQRAELTVEFEAARAEAERLRAHEAGVAGWAETADAEAAALERLADVRRAIAGSGEASIEPVRAVLARTFDRFVIHRASSPSAPRRLHAELAMVGGTGCVIEPVIRREAVEDYSDSLRPVLRRVPLGEPGAERDLALSTNDSGVSASAVFLHPIRIPAA